MKEIKDITERVKADRVRFIQLQFTDIHGSIKSVTITAARLPEALMKGVWFDGSSIEGFTRISESDMYLMPDMSTYLVLPWSDQDSRIARLICDIYTPDGKPFEGNPRYILKRALDQAEKMGYTYHVGPELEFFLFQSKQNGSPIPVVHDSAGYFDYSPRDMADEVRREVIIALEKMNMEVEMSHHEVASGQHEIDIKYGNAMIQADRCITFKYTVKSIANKHGLHASFMPKPIFGENGSGMHVHQSLFDMNNRVNLFYDKDNPYGISTIALQFIAGQLHHIRGISSILSPTVNSYKRLVPGYEAPVYICFGQRNRSALIRIPRISSGRETSTRAELRCPDPSCNPYLAFAAMLHAGLDGITKKRISPEPNEEDVYTYSKETLHEKGIQTLPRSLGEAIEETKKSDIAQSALGPHSYEMYIFAKTKEWEEYRMQVTPWEHKKYFDIL